MLRQSNVQIELAAETGSPARAASSVGEQTTWTGFILFYFFFLCALCDILETPKLQRTNDSDGGEQTNIEKTVRTVTELGVGCRVRHLVAGCHCGCPAPRY